MKKAQGAKKKKPRPAKGSKERRDSDDIERAVYDGMQDLRVKKKPGTA